jgi:hypothetical protein
MLKNLVLTTGIALGLMTGIASATTINFEGGGIGAFVDSDYSGLGATFTNAQYKQCFGGCPSPAFGNFVSSPDFASVFTVNFASLQSSVSFTNITNSTVLAKAFDSSDNLLDSLIDTQSGTFIPNVETLNGVGIAYVTFEESPDNTVRGFGIDNLVFGPTPVPEPITLSLFSAGVAGIAAMRRRKKAQHG